MPPICECCGTTGKVHVSICLENLPDGDDKDKKRKLWQKGFEEAKNGDDPNELMLRQDPYEIMGYIAYLRKYERDHPDTPKIPRNKRRDHA